MVTFPSSVYINEAELYIAERIDQTIVMNHSTIHTDKIITKMMHGISLTFHPPTVHHLRYRAAEVMTN